MVDLWCLAWLCGVARRVRLWVVFGTSVLMLPWASLSAQAERVPVQAQPAAGVVVSVPWGLGLIAVTLLLCLGAVALSRCRARRLAAMAQAQATESALQRERALLDSLPDGVLLLDGKDRIVRVNRALSEMFGYPAEALLGGHVDALLGEGVGPASLRGDGWLDQIMRGHQWGQHRDGRQFPIELAVSGLPAFGADGGYSLLIRDISQRLALEHRLVQARKMELLGELAAGIAHELNTPSQYVQNNLSFLQDAMHRLEPLLRDRAAWDERAADDLQEIPNAFAQSQEGIAQILEINAAMKAYSHPSRGQRQPVDLNQILQTAIQLSRHEWHHCATMETKLATRLPLVSGVWDELSVVLLNLIVNAAHAIEARQVREPEFKGRIELTTRQQGGWLEVVICDNGCGIDPQIRPRLFESFFTTKPVGKGTGQGLSLAQKVVKRHGGEIWVDSVAEGGSCFTVRLPRVGPSGTSADISERETSHEA
ncbi:two-component system sensor histidine kinase NtrB [Ferrimonas pelagia]|uniref:histidine kinase n=1 Tax=Ferrimonas pelagia TaxID=1177826 RepID=A0ABP9FG02_9GAMM